jgi:hypothetical protein
MKAPVGSLRSARSIACVADHDAARVKHSAAGESTALRALATDPASI